MLLSLSMINSETFLLVFARDRRKLRGYLTWVHLRCAILNDERRGVAVSRCIGSVEVDLQLRGRRYKTIRDNKETGKY